MELSIENTGKGYVVPKMAVIRKMERLAVFNEVRNEVKKRNKHKKKKNRKKDEKDGNPFQDWCMPEQPTRYLRGSDHDFF